MIALVAEALRVQVQDAPDELIDQAQQAMRETLQLEPRWYSTVTPTDTLVGAAPRIYPLHPTVLPVLIRLFKRFGQNERSLFSFLFSHEPYGLQSFAQQPIAEGVFYRLHHLYDYARAVFGHMLSIQSYRSHWNVIDALIQSFHSEDTCALHILKTVGLLNLLNSPELLPSEEAILLAISDDPTYHRNQVKTVLHQLQQEWHILYYRGAAGGFCLWPYTSVNLEAAFEQSARAVPPIDHVGSLLPGHIAIRPIVARRHYIETGNLRYFDIKYVPIDQLETTLQASTSADGHIVIALCETEEERQRAIAFASDHTLQHYPTCLVAVPPALTRIVPLLHNVQRWQWVQNTTPELMNDTHAAEEVSRQITAARITLEKRLQDAIGFHASVRVMGLQWFRGGHRLQHITSGRDVFRTLSDVCDEVYAQAPRIQNELVNRQMLSSAAAAARMRLIEGILERSSEPFLGMNASKNPPEIAMYRSVLQKSEMHRAVQGILTITEPDNDACKVLPSLRRIQEIVTDVPDQRIIVSDIFAALRQPPYGVRNGLIPVLLAVFVMLHEQHVALYEDGRFISHICGFNFQCLIKAPHTFELQYCTLAGIRTEVFQRLLAVLEINPDQQEHTDILGVVRPLCTFAAQLPPYTQQTQQMSALARAVRDTLLAVSEPAPMLFWHLPIACGVAGFGPDDRADNDHIHQFITALKAALDELKAAYLNLQQRISQALFDTLDLQQREQDIRHTLETRVNHILPAVREPHLKAFCLRLIDFHMPEVAWIDSIGSLVCSKPPRLWSDSDEQTYYEKLAQICARFQRVESMMVVS